MLLPFACACWFAFAFFCERLCKRIAALSLEGRRYCERRLPAHIDSIALKKWQSVARACMRLHCSKFIVKGREALNVPGPKLIVANHCHYLDPAVFLLKIEKPAWYMASHLVFKFGFNIVGAFIGRAGAFPVNTEPGRGGPAIRDAIRLLSAGETVVIFPEGDAYFDSQTEAFQSGAIQIARLAEKQSGKAIPIVPVYLDYEGRPGRWIRKLPFALQCVLVMLSFPLWRRPLRVTVGQGFSQTELPKDRKNAAAILRERLLALKKQPAPCN